MTIVSLLHICFHLTHLFWFLVSFCAGYSWLQRYISIECIGTMIFIGQSDELLDTGGNLETFYSFWIKSFTIRHWKFDNTVMGNQKSCCDSFTSSPTHRCLYVECAIRKKPVIFLLIGISDPGTRNPIWCPFDVKYKQSQTIIVCL